MRLTLLSSVAFLSLAASSASALARELILEPTSPNLVPEAFQYRFDATRRWPGCYGYDFLHDTGLYPLVFEHEVAFTPADGDYRATFRPTWRERFCAAELGIYNYVPVVWTNPDDPSERYRGVLQVDARGPDKLDEVRCVPVDSGDPWNTLECERASVDLSSDGAAYVLLNVSGLD